MLMRFIISHQIRPFWSGEKETLAKAAIRTGHLPYLLLRVKYALLNYLADLQPSDLRL